MMKPASGTNASADRTLGSKSQCVLERNPAERICFFDEKQRRDAVTSLIAGEEGRSSVIPVGVGCAAVAKCLLCGVADSAPEAGLGRSATEYGSSGTCGPISGNSCF